MLRILVADDEELERKALRLILQEGEERVEILEAENGREAARLARAEALDVAFLDVRMPGVDGIEAARLIRAARPDAPIVFLTAYDSFAYAREALRLGIDEYLLKPASGEEVRAALARALGNGRSRRAAAEYLARGLRSALASGGPSDGEVEEYRARAWPDVPAAGPRLALAFRLDPATRYAPQSAERDAAALARAADLAERLFASRSWRAVAGSGSERGLAFALARPGAESSPAAVEAILAEFRERARADLGALLLVGASSCERGPREGAPGGGASFGGASFGGASFGGASDEALCRAAAGAASLARADRPQVVTRCVPGSGEAAERGRASRPVERALALMADRLAEDMSLESVAAELKLSASHLSRLLALEAGAGFGDCLARMRIDRAKGLLASGSSVKEAASLVGFKDAAYFARVFRRLEGTSPGEYRCGAKEEEQE